MNTYDIYFTDGKSTERKGFALKSAEKAIKMAKDMLAKPNTLVHDYVQGRIQVRSSDGELIWEEIISDIR